MSDKPKNIVTAVLFSAITLTLSLFLFFAPSKDFSLSERRELAKFPSLTPSSVSSGKFMSEFEDFTLDQFPLRDVFRSVKAYASKYIFLQKSNNGIYVNEGVASKIEYPVNYDSVSYASKKLRYIYDTYLENGNVYMSVIPDKNAFLAKDNGQLSIDYDEFYSLVKSSVDFASFIDIHGLLSADDYYATDTHWKQENLLPVASMLAEGMGAVISDDFTVKNTDIPFSGVYSGQSALPLKTDTLCLLESPSFENCRIFDHQNNREISFYDMEKAHGKDPYEMYLSGPLSLITIENPNSGNDRRLIIFRDSFASSIAPILSTAFSHITLVDIRYLPSSQLHRYIDFDGSDVLFLYSTSVLNNSNTLK